MSAILSASDLNDFISPGVACIKPVETLPKQAPTTDPSNPYEVTTEDKVPAAADAPPAQISLTDCLACSGCVTSAEAVLVSLQSHNEVLNMLDAHPAIHSLEDMQARLAGGEMSDGEGRIFVASVSPQTRASIAATYGVTERQAGNMIAQLLSGEQGLKSGGKHGSSFTWVVDTNTVREICQSAVTEEALRAAGVASPFTNTPFTQASITSPKLPILASACPGWICYAEKTHPHVLPNLSALRSPQAMSGVLLKSVLARRFNIPPSRIYHIAVMPCFDKKLEASREELTDIFWRGDGATNGKVSSDQAQAQGIRDTDTVITARELLTLAEARGISFPLLPRTPVTFPPFPDSTINSFLFPSSTPTTRQHSAAGPSGGYAHSILTSLQHSFSTTYANSTITTTRGRNADVIEYTLLSSSGEPLLRTARYYGFRNIQNLVRRLKPAKASRMPGAARRVGKLAGAENKRTGAGGKGAEGGSGSATESEFAYIEVMACPGGCTNGGGQIKVDDVGGLRGVDGESDGQEEKANGFDDESVVVGDGITTAKRRAAGPAEQKEWLKRVDEAYYSADSDEESSTSTPASASQPEALNGTNGAFTNGHSNSLESDTTTNDTISVQDLLHHWTTITKVPLDKLLYTTYRQVESDVGKEKAGAGGSDMERVAGLASSLGGGW